ncbi:MAG: peptidoglycan DD-metalloendopeptidase family protein [Crocinitomicaceae bacterium]
MKSAIKILLFASLFSSGVFGQVKTANLKKEQKKLERKISNTKSLLKKVASTRAESLSELQLINNQIQSREDLLRLFDRQVVLAEGFIRQKETDVATLNERVLKLKEQYKAMILHSYKSRNKNGRMMFVLSAENYYEAQKRNKYLKNVTALHKKQVALIANDQQKIKSEIAAIELEKSRKKEVLTQKRLEREEIEVDREKKEQVLKIIQKKEAQLLAEIKSNEIKKQQIKVRIAEAIRKELAEIERKRKEAARKRRDANTGIAESPNFTDASSEGKIVSKNFEKNRGSLPWPVEEGAITERFGKNKHPSLNDVYTNNNGVDISCRTGAETRAVFAGKVTAVFPIAGAGKVVILKHGNYRTVYSNLKESFVSIGDEVKIKSSLGVVMNQDSGLGQLHFEIHFVSGLTTKSLNPSLWVDL